MNKLCKEIKTVCPDVEINDRIADIELSTYRVFEDRHIPTETPVVPWEHVNTIGYSWDTTRNRKKRI